MNAKRVSLALQGGGSHGAFTWGVLDRLLEDGRLSIDAISGASAGAMNAVVMAHGWTAGGRDGARQALKDFWEGISATARFGARPENLEGTDVPAPQAAEGIGSLYSIMRHFAPRQFNPFDVNPLRDLLESQVDFEQLRRACPIDLQIATTQVKSGMLRLFGTSEITRDVLLASACVPELHHSVEIDGEAYWDGGLSANPPLFPLVRAGRSRDLVMVLLQPALRGDTPGTAPEIRSRLNEIAFTSAFFAELQGLSIARNEAAARFPFARSKSAMKDLRLHRVDSPEFMGRLSAVSKLNVHPEFIGALRDEGRGRAELWLAAAFDEVGVRSTFDLDGFLQRRGASAEGPAPAPARGRLPVLSQAARGQDLRAG